MTKVALLLVPDEIAFDPAYRISRGLPLGPAVLNAYLKKQGLTMDLYDLGLDLADLAPNIDKATLRSLYDKEAVIGFLNGKDEPTIRSFIESLLADKDLLQYDVVGISCGANFSWMEIHSAFLIGKHIQQTCGAPIVFGGGNIEYLVQFRDTFHELWINILDNFRFVVCGAGEEAFYGVIQYLSGEKKSLEDLPGLVHLDQGRVLHNPRQTPLIIKPDFHGLCLDRYASYTLNSHRGDVVDEEIERRNIIQIYKWPGHMPMSQYANQAHIRGQGGVVDKLVIPYIFSYNCPFHCAFCIQSGENRQKFVHGNMARVAQDIAEMMEEYDTPYFYFLNNAFNYSRRFVQEFCTLVRERDLKFYWSDCARFNGLDLDQLRMMQKAGCQKLAFGVETASPKLLKMLGRNMDLDEAKRVLEWCHEVGIWVDVNVIVGFPHEYDEDFEITRRFLEENRELVNFCAVNVYFIVPDSLIGLRPGQYGIQVLKDKKAYEHSLEANYQWFAGGKGSFKPQNYALYKFDEIGGRGYQELAQINRKKAATMRAEVYRGKEYLDFAKSMRMLAALSACQR